MRQFALAAAILAGSVGAAGAGQVADEVARRQAFEHYQAGQQLMAAESWPEAEKEFRAAIGLDPLFTLAHYSLGQTCMAMKDYPAAVRGFGGAVQAHKDIVALRALGQAQDDQRIEYQIQEMRDGLRSIQGSTKLQALGLRDKMILNLEEQIRVLENQKRKGLAPAEVPAEFSLALGSAHFRNGALPEASLHYAAALKVRPRFGEAHNNLAVVYMMLGRFDDAEREMKAAEKAGFKVNPQFKADLERRLKGA